MKSMLRRLTQPAKPLLLALVCCTLSTQTWALNWVSSAIEGTDADADGIRDDVGDYIRQQWNDKELQFWAFEAARASQAYLMSNSNPYALHRAHSFMARARRCLTEKHSPDMARLVINKVLGAQLDTYERRQIYQQALNEWVHKIQHQDLPSQPDANWSESCGSPTPPQSPQNNLAQTLSSDLPKPSSQEENLPPPNFFLGAEASAEAGTQLTRPSGSVLVKPLTAPQGLATSQANEDNSEAAAPPADLDTPSSWTTYTPRARAKPQKTVSKRSSGTHLPVQKIRPGESAAAPQKPASRPQPASTVAVKALSTKPVVPRSKRPATVAYQKPSTATLPPGLQELAPYIRSIERR